MHFLIAEDDETNRLVLKTFLSRFGKCTVVKDGREALEAMQSAYLQRQGFDLVCMDLKMPAMDGHEAIKKIRGFELEQGILRPSKILVMTAMTDMANITQALLGKCNAYLMKPIDLRLLQAELEELGVLEPASIKA